MAIRDRIRRALRKSDSSESDVASHTGSSNTTATLTTAATSETYSVRKPTSPAAIISRALGFSGGRDKMSNGRRYRKSLKSTVHPSQRPLTLQNLRHQEMLSHFIMTFGASDPSQVESLSFCGVNPCCTRRPSASLSRTDVSAPDLGVTTPVEHQGTTVTARQ